MMDFNCPEFDQLEQELKEDFYASTQESIEIMDGCVDRLAENNNMDDLNELFRAVHSVKGNCNMVFLAPIVESLHELEEIVTDVRDGSYPYHASYGEFFQAVIHETDEVLRNIMNNGLGDQQLLNQLAQLTSAVHHADDADRVKLAGLCTDAISQAHFSLEIATTDQQQRLEKEQQTSMHEEHNVSKCELMKAEKMTDSLSFFEDLVTTAYVLDEWRPIRLQRTLQLSEDLNQQFSNAVDEIQLKAAVFVHEFSMRMVPEHILNKSSALNEKETKIVQNHVHIAAGLLNQIPGFSEAANILKCHHERYDGKGYPDRLDGDDIPIGAVILAMTDTFIAITSDRADRSYKKTLMTAVREINTEKNKRFSEEQVDLFNHLIKSTYIGKARW